MREWYTKGSESVSTYCTCSVSGPCGQFDETDQSIIKVWDCSKIERSGTANLLRTIKPQLPEKNPPQVSEWGSGWRGRGCNECDCRLRRTSHC